MRVSNLSAAALAGLSCLSIASPVAADDDGAPALAPAPASLTVRYSGSVAIFRVADIQMSSELGGDTYQASARFTTAGLAALFSDADIEAGVSGYRHGARLQPWRYEHFNHASGSNRTVGINFPEGVAEPDINPPFGSMGEPPATAAERAGAIDPISALLSVTTGMIATGDNICEGRVPVFDGKARYNLRFEEGEPAHVRTRAWRGEARICRAWYEPVAGYDADEYPDDDDIDEPLTFWMAPAGDSGYWVPVKIRANTGFGGVTVVAREMSVE